jgi:hypothetical protein
VSAAVVRSSPPSHTPRSRLPLTRGHGSRGDVRYSIALQLDRKTSLEPIVDGTAVELHRLRVKEW